MVAHHAPQDLGSSPENSQAEQVRVPRGRGGIAAARRLPPPPRGPLHPGRPARARLSRQPASTRPASAPPAPRRADKRRGRAGPRVTVKPDSELAAPTVVLHADGAALLRRARRHGGRRVRHGRWDLGCGRAAGSARGARTRTVGRPQAAAQKLTLGGGSNKKGGQEISCAVTCSARPVSARPLCFGAFLLALKGAAPLTASRQGPWASGLSRQETLGPPQTPSQRHVTTCRAILTVPSQPPLVFF